MYTLFHWGNDSRNREIQTVDYRDATVTKQEATGINHTSYKVLSSKTGRNSAGEHRMPMWQGNKREANRNWVDHLGKVKKAENWKWPSTSEAWQLFGDMCVRNCAPLWNIFLSPSPRMLEYSCTARPKLFTWLLMLPSQIFRLAQWVFLPTEPSD